MGIKYVKKGIYLTFDRGIIGFGHLSSPYCKLDFSNFNPKLSEMLKEIFSSGNMYGWNP